MTLLRFSMIFVTFALLGYSYALAETSDITSDVKYFKDPELDYWKEKDLPKSPYFSGRSEKKSVQIPVVATNTKSQFPWNKYLSPANEEFFKEGDYTPPAPFMEIARNPTDENIENWFRYLGIKNELLRNLQQHLTDYASKHATPKIARYEQSVPRSLDDESVSKIKSRMETPDPVAVDSKNFRLRLYFDSHCPHCQKMLGTVAELMRMGYWVKLKQVDHDTSIRAKIPFAVTDAMPEELKRYQIESVPVLLIGDLKRKTFVKVEGYHDTGDVIRAIDIKR